MLGFFFTFAALVVGYVALWFWTSGYPLIDPAPEGEGSYEEIDDAFVRFRRFYQTANAGGLPTGFVRLTGLDEDDEETWMIYYATASHRTKRGGTIVLMGSDGRIDGYFGHHCSKVDGGTVIVGSKGLRLWSGGTFYGRFNEVRDAFNSTFKHERTEQVGASDGDKPPS